MSLYDYDISNIRVDLLGLSKKLTVRVQENSARTAPRETVWAVISSVKTR